MEDTQKVHNLIQLLYTTKSEVIKDGKGNTMVAQVSMLTEQEQELVKKELFTLLELM